jgi:chorismate synthase
MKMSNSLGCNLRMTTFGESHGRCIGVIVDGFPAGLKISKQEVQRELDKRKPGQSPLTTSRNEADQVDLLSGIFKGHTTGAPICMIIWNKDRDSTGYYKRRWTPRPGHADYSAYIKYGGYNDFRGGGRFSGRITASYVMAGALTKKLLKKTMNVEVIAHTKKVGSITADKLAPEEILKNKEENPIRCGDNKAASQMAKAIEKASKKGDSLGGIIECFISNLPAGIGEPVFDNIEGVLSRALFSIPAVKSVEFGLGCKLSSLKGSESNDSFIIRDEKITVKTNNSGGILGGISIGATVFFTIAIKPTPSINKEQNTVNLKSLKETTIKISGRHDPCIVPRAVPVVEAITSFVIADLAMKSGHIPRIMKESE